MIATVAHSSRHRPMIDVAASLSAGLHNATDRRPTDNNQHNDEIRQAIDDYDRYDQLLI